MKIETVIFDMDGVIYRGEKAIPGAKEAVRALEKAGKEVFFLTNNGSRTRGYFAKKLASFGIKAPLERVYCTSYGAAKYMSENMPGSTAYVLEEDTEDEFTGAGIRCVHDEKADAVVVGLDRNLTYRKLSIAFRALMGGAEFIATNDDPKYPVEDGFLPGAGAIVASLAYSTGKRPLVIGKPEPYMLDLIVKEHGVRKERSLMVGDQISTDILMAKREGMMGALVLTGVSSRAEAMEGKIRPDFVVDSIREMPGVIRDWESPTQR
ncbi:MAG: HAD-IIA family hydrolase [Candidatus ainarchaeum sp.]|nr:HAD-IIA family hydrolase [Candidatus ainarchaeum sp.]